MKQQKRQILLIGRLNMNVSELAEKLNELNTKLDKATGEILAEVAALQAALLNVEIPTEAQDALDSLTAKVQALDDLNPDTPAV